MDELELVRLHEDGEHLVLGGPGGAQYTVAITEKLRAAVRRDRPHLEHLRAEGESRLVPREIQARLRAGHSVEDVADAAGIAPENVRRFSGPIEAEQDYVVSRVRASGDVADDDALTLGDLVDRRLEARDVVVADAHWSATRAQGAPWVVQVRFEAGSGARTARWTYDPSTRVPQALDDEARWLSEPESEPDPSPGTAAVFDVDASPRGPRALRSVAPPAPDETDEADETDPTHELLDDLSQRRGVRARDAVDEGTVQDPFEGFGPLADAAREQDGADQGARIVQLPSIPGPDADGTPAGARGARSGDEAAGSGSRTDENSVVDPAPDDDGPRPGGHNRKGKNRSRAKMPSWDEIVFGARPEG